MQIFEALQRSQASPIDSLSMKRVGTSWLSYVNESDANSFIPITKRTIGMIVVVQNTLYAYIGGIANENLVPISSSPAGPIIGSLVTGSNTVLLPAGMCALFVILNGTVNNTVALGFTTLYELESGASFLANENYEFNLNKRLRIDTTVYLNLAQPATYEIYYA